MQLSYSEVERSTFEFLLNQHKESKGFTFSVRKRATKGSESDYFIGTKRANYFAFTLWWIPVNYPGTSADLIDYVIWLRDDRIFFKVEYSISNKAKNAQNASNIQLGQLIEREFTQAGFTPQIYNAPKATYAIALHDAGNYTSIQEYLNALSNFIKTTSPIFDSAIFKNHEKSKNWIAHRITLDQFYNDFLSDLLRRFKKYDGPFDETQSQIQSKIGEEGRTEFSPKNVQRFALNTILYGPPGTGKTYFTIDYAVRIADPARYRSGDHAANKLVFEELKEQGQIVFTTFHQSYSYEDFIEGIKPKMESEELTYEIKDGVFKELCTRARAKNERSFEEAYSSLVKGLSALDDDKKLELNTPTGKSFSISLNTNENLNLFTGKERLKQGVLTKQNILKQLNGEPKFIGWEGYFNGVIDYLKAKYKFNPEKNDGHKNYVLIIDEINRGNVSQILVS